MDNSCPKKIRGESLRKFLLTDFGLFVLYVFSLDTSLECILKSKSLSFILWLFGLTYNVIFLVDGTGLH